MFYSFIGNQVSFKCLNINFTVALYTKRSSIILANNTKPAYFPQIREIHGSGNGAFPLSDKRLCTEFCFVRQVHS